jgi:hypothetical protein
LLAPCPTPKIEDHPLSAVHNCFFNIFTATFHTWRPSPPSSPKDATCHHLHNLYCFIITFFCKTGELVRNLNVILSFNAYIIHNIFNYLAW